MSDTWSVTGNGTPSLASYAKLLTAAEVVITSYTQTGETEPVSRTEIPLTGVSYTGDILTCDDLNCGYVETETCTYIDYYDSNDVKLIRRTLDAAINLADTDGYIFEWRNTGVFITNITITLTGSGDGSLTSYYKLLTAAEAEITSYDHTLETSRTEIPITGVSFVDSILDADDIVCGYVVTGTCKYIDVYDSNDVKLFRWTLDTAIDLADTENYTFTWPDGGIGLFTALPRCYIEIEIEMRI
jgi:hypothetical protein